MTGPILPRTCTACGAEKTASNEFFARSKSGRNGLATQCKECAKTATAAWNKANPGRTAEAMRAHRRANPEKIAAQRAARHAANRERDNQRSRKWRLANIEKARAISAAWQMANQERVQEYRRRYRAEHIGRITAYYADWYARNREHAVAYSEARRAADPERDRMNARMWYESHKDQGRKSRREWARANLDKRIIYSQNRRARKLLGGGKLSPGLAGRLFKLQKGRCACCGVRLTTFHLDHIEPLALGGKNDDFNIQLLSPKCNMKKGARSPQQFAKMLGRLI